MSEDKDIPKQQTELQVQDVFDFLLDEKETDSKHSDDYYKILQKVGFQITCSGDDMKERLLKKIEELKKNSEQKVDDLNVLYSSAIDKLEENITIISNKLDALKEKESKHDKKIDELKLRFKTLTDEIDSIKKRLLEIRESFSTSKHGLGQKMIADVEIELTNVFKLQKSIHNECQALNEDRYNVIKDSSAVIIEKLNTIRTSYYDQLKILQEKIVLLNENGINQRVSYILVWLGTASAGVAGYFFSIFSAQANYSSQDALYFLLQNTLRTIYSIEIPLFLKLIYLIVIIVVITAFSWFIDWLIKKKTFYSENKNKGQEAHRFAADLNISNVRYSVNTQSKSWILLWLRIAPLALIIGMALIFLAQKDSTISNINILSASTEGLLIGTAFAMSLASVLYLYVEKIIEKRKNKENTLVKNWELGIVMCLFIIIIVTLSFYQSSKNFSRLFPLGIFSMIGFLGASFLTAFAFAYGMRYFGLIESTSSVEYRISQLDADIWRLSFPAQLQFDVNGYFDNLDELQQLLLKNLQKKSQALGNVSNNLSIESVEPSNGLTNIIKLPIKWNFNKRKITTEDSGLFELSEWEIEFFPEFSERIKAIANLYHDKKRQIEEAKNDIERYQSEKDKLIENINNQSTQLLKEKEKLTATQIKLRIKMLKIKMDLFKEFEKEKTYLQDGFDLGKMYHSQN